jgi:N-methylhydantoinase A
VALRARVVCALEERSDGRFAGVPSGEDSERQAYFAGDGTVTAAVRSLGRLEAGEPLAGPALVESPLTTVVIEPGTVAERWPGAGLIVRAEDGSGADREGRGNADFVAS